MVTEYALETLQIDKHLHLSVVSHAREQSHMHNWFQHIRNPATEVNCDVKQCSTLGTLRAWTSIPTISQPAGQPPPGMDFNPGRGILGVEVYTS